MKVFVINPVERTITEAEYSGVYTEIYTLGGFDCFSVVNISDGDGIFVDDEGLLKSGQSFFGVTGYPQPLAGCGVVIGTDMDGDSVEPTVTLEWLRSNVVFLGKANE